MSDKNVASYKSGQCPIDHEQNNSTKTKLHREGIER